jgi:transposase-like protein
MWKPLTFLEERIGKSRQSSPERLRSGWSAQLSSSDPRTARRGIDEIGPVGIVRGHMRDSAYANNLIESDHRSINRRLRALQGPRSAPTARRLLQRIEAVHMIRKSKVFAALVQTELDRR